MSTSFVDFFRQFRPLNLFNSFWPENSAATILFQLRRPTSFPHDHVPMAKISIHHLPGFQSFLQESFTRRKSKNDCLNHRTQKIVTRCQSEKPIRSTAFRLYFRRAILGHMISCKPSATKQPQQQQKKVVKKRIFLTAG